MKTPITHSKRLEKYLKPKMVTEAIKEQVAKPEEQTKAEITAIVNTSQTQQDIAILDALATHVVDLSKMVESMLEKPKPAIIATIKRDKDGKMSSIHITEQ